METVVTNELMTSFINTYKYLLNNNYNKIASKNALNIIHHVVYFVHST